MFKHGVKVVLITILCAVVAVCLVFMALACFAPSKMSDFYSTLGINGRAYVYAEKAYEKNQSVDQLVKLSNIAIKCNDNEKINSSLEKLINHSEFSNYIKSISTGDRYYDFVTSEYIKSCYALELYEDKELCEKALKFAKNGYRHANAIESLILVATESSDLPLLQEICITLNAYHATGTCVKTSVNRLNKDIFNLEELIQRLKTNE